MGALLEYWQCKKQSKGATRLNVLRPLLALPLLLLMACTEEPVVIPATEVVIDKVKEEPYRPTMSFVGRLQAENDVKIQAKVTGYLDSWHFNEGDIINKGDVLYEIDPAQFKADLSSANANLASAQAEVTVSKRNFLRGKELLPKGAISASEMDKLEAKKLQADANLEGAKAQVLAAEVNLGYTQVQAPINGRIGRSAFSAGDLIGPDSGVLTSLVSIDPMKALFQISESIYLARTNEMAKKSANGEPVEELVIRLELTDKSIYPHTGKMDYISNRIDENTGTLEARATIPNPDGFLRPGQYVRVLVETPFDVPTKMIPQSAVQADQQGNYIFSVGPDNKVLRKNIEVGQRVGSRVVVMKGLADGEVVVVQGLQKVRPGQVVRTRTISDTTTGAAPQAAEG